MQFAPGFQKPKKEKKNGITDWPVIHVNAILEGDYFLTFNWDCQ